MFPLILSVLMPVLYSQNPTRPLPEFWFDDDEWRREVQYIISPEELSAYRQLKTTEVRDRFISQFWLRRDPTPGTTQNEFRDEHYRRVEYANGHFANPTNPSRSGMETDRGRIYVMLGPPDRIDRYPTASFEIWHYAGAAGSGSVFTVQFSLPPIDSCDGSYQITSAPVGSFQAVRAAVQVFPRGFITASIPMDFAKTVSISWMLRTGGGAPVLENDDAVMEGEFGPAKNNEPLSKHLLGCRTFGPGGMAYTHPLPPGSYTFSSVVTLTSGDVQRDTVRFDVK